MPLTLQYANVQGIALTADGKVLTLSGGGCGSCWNLVRLNGDGTIDSDFAAHGVFSGRASGDLGILDWHKSVATADDGALVGGACGPRITNGRQYCMLRINTAGRVTEAFGIAGEVASNDPSWQSVNSMLEQDDGRILVAGNCGKSGATMRFCAARHHVDGRVDTTFGSQGSLLSTLAFGAVALKSRSRFAHVSIACDRSDSAGNPIALCAYQFDERGVVDGSFGAASGVTMATLSSPQFFVFRKLLAQNDGSLFVVVDCYRENGPCIVRYDASGNRDLQYAGGKSVLVGGRTSRSAVLQKNGALLLLGECNSRTTTCIWRYEGTTPSPSEKRLMVEYRYEPLDYYFLTSRVNEQSLLDRTNGWTRTGLSHSVASQSAPNLSPITRFYFFAVARSQTRGSHFYTLLPIEVALVQSTNPYNVATPGKPGNEGIDSYAFLPNDNEECLGGTQPVYRAFRANARFPDDPNRRFSSSRMVYRRLVANGWDGERIKYCAPLP